MPKFNSTERSLVQTMVATLSIKRIPDAEIINEVYDRTKKTITEKTIYKALQNFDSVYWEMKPHYSPTLDTNEKVKERLD